MSRYAIRLTPKQCIDLYEDDLAKTEQLVKQLQAENELLENLLKIAKCPQCNGSGGIPHQFAECQWCYEKKHVLEALKEVKK